jgi:hypothetical protein
LNFNVPTILLNYEAILLGLRKARATGIQRLIIKTDSQVVAGYIEKDYKARDQELAKYLQFLREQEKYFEGFIVKNISRTDNSDADEIAKVTAQNTSLPQDIFFQVLTHASIKTKQKVQREVHIIQSEDRRAPIMAYLRGHYEPEDKVNKVRMKNRTRNYKIINNQLYKQKICEPLLKYISTEEGKELLSEIHEGICGTHLGARAMAEKAF